jgi:undecaprenyl-diphosphatase
VRRWLLGGIAVLACAPAPFTCGAETPAPPPPAVGEGAPLGFGAAATLGVVEGLTEFLPISSTGHLILANHLLELDRETQARDPAGALLWKKSPDPVAGFAGEPFSVKAAADQYAIVIQFGAILAVALIYWRTIVSILAGLVGRDPAGLRLLRNLLVAFFPAVVFGLTLDDWIDANLFSIRAVAGALVVGALLMLVVSRWQHHKATRAGDTLPDPALADLTMKQALLIGLMQCVALWPGTSRSMMTLVGGYLVGLRPARAAEFTFLLGLPTLGGAAVYKAMGGGALMVKAFGIMPLVVGGFVAAISAGIAVRWMVAYLTRHGLALFAWYRLVLAALVVWIWL